MVFHEDSDADLDRVNQLLGGGESSGGGNDVFQEDGRDEFYDIQSENIELASGFGAGGNGGINPLMNIVNNGYKQSKLFQEAATVTSKKSNNAFKTPEEILSENDDSHHAADK